MIPLQAVPTATSSTEPTVGEIKRALHHLSCATGPASQRDTAAILREIHELVRRLALVDGVDPDQALQRRRDAARLQRESLVLASAAAPGPAPT